MKMVSAARIEEFSAQYAETRDQLRSWFDFVKRVTWLTPTDIKRDFRSVSIIDSKILVFNIKGGDYRLVVRINYKTQRIYIRGLFTHAEYDKIDVREV